jgi:hypothetical protein
MDVRGRSRGFVDAFKKEYGLGRENWAEQRRRVRYAEGKAENAPRILEMIEGHPGIIRMRENLGLSPKRAEMVREDMGLGLEPKGSGRRAGQMLGAMAADLTQDTSRGFYWLLNALQATGAVGAELAYGTRRPDLFSVEPVLGPNGQKVRKGKDDDLAKNMRIIDENKNLRRGIRLTDDGDDQGAYYVKQKFDPGDVNSLLIPSGIAINAGLGLLSPFGGITGYEAAIPSAEDKSKTDNVIGEVAAKYIMGRTGNLLPYEEFSKVRPDVSRAEYNAYKAFKYDKKGDMDISDGDIGLPTGALKFTTDGIHGPELMMLGRGLPVTTGVIPYATSVAGTAAGVGMNRPIRGGLVGGLAGLAVGQVAGNLIEGERRRRNQAQNESYGEL